MLRDSHVVQFHGSDDRTLTRNVASYLREGLDAGESIVVIAAEPRLGRLLTELGASGEAALAGGQAQFCDANLTLESICVDGVPSWPRFEAVVGAIVASAAERSGSVRAYGEMVALLWRNEQRHAAIILEGYWNRLLAAHPCRLFCAYPIDVLTDDLDDPLVSCALAAHSHLMPCGEDVDRAVELAVDEVLGAKAESVRLGIEAKRHSSGRAAGPSESIVFWLRRSVPEYAEQILERARSHYRLGMAGSR